MEGDIPEETVMLRSNLSVVLAGLPLFEGLDHRIVSEIAAIAEWMSLPGGATLFRAGELPDALYVVLSGCLGAFSAESRDRRRFMGRVLAGDIVGEMGVISGRPRTAHVVALRDTEMVRVSSEAFHRVFGRYPDAMMRIARLTVDRLESSQTNARGSRQGARTFTLLPQSIDVDVGGFATEFVKALSAFGRTELVWSVRAGSHSSHWFHQIESANDYVVYVGDSSTGRWSSLCVRQADGLVLLARAEATPGQWAALAAPREPNLVAQRAELVLMHDGQIVRGAASRWLADHPGLPHHHMTSSTDIARLARMLTGRGVGLVLSGGGARGFAHIGIVKALREAGIPIDLVGGTSMGAILGAGVAQCWSVEELTQRFRRAFVESKPLRDYTLPFVSLVSGRKVSRLLRNDFGDLTIEDLPLDFFCVSSNLTTGHTVVHRRGELWRWLRASVAIPGVLPPVVHKGEVLVDGGTMNNLPVDAMRELGRGPVIACDVGADRAFTTDSEESDMPLPWQLMSWLRTRRRRPNIFQILWRAGMVNSSAMTAAHRDKTDLLLQPPLAKIDMLNWSAFEQAIAAGYEYAARRLDTLPSDAQLRTVTVGLQTAG
ncbi:MAG TPA: patatin-like phospholipase family protein [Steroidobacteraceae bacterium]|nr:patatin-like phospholipase family protein [Steroidobacteraceae bacterium]